MTCDRPTSSGLLSSIRAFVRLSVEESSFEEWLLSERLRLRELALEGLARLLADQRDRRALVPAVQTALRLVALDPLPEPVHRTLMRL